MIWVNSCTLLCTRTHDVAFKLRRLLDDDEIIRIKEAISIWFNENEQMMMIIFGRIRTWKSWDSLWPERARLVWARRKSNGWRCDRRALSASSRSCRRRLWAWPRRTFAWLERTRSPAAFVSTRPRRSDRELWTCTSSIWSPESHPSSRPRRCKNSSRALWSTL